MPISVARKLQALRDLLYPELDIQLHAVALTLAQCRELHLPSTPLKESERRGDRWRAVMGWEQTEIDALAALRPRELRQIAEKAVAPFFDASLARRQSAARAAWYKAAEPLLEHHPLWQRHVDQVREALASLKDAAIELRSAQGESERTLAGIKLPLVEAPEAVIEAERRGRSSPRMMILSAPRAGCTTTKRSTETLNKEAPRNLMQSEQTPPIHPAAERLPMMSDAEIDELAADIKKNGLQQPIIIWVDNREEKNGTKPPFPEFVIDGRNRIEALRRLGDRDIKPNRSFSLKSCSTIRKVYAIRQCGTIRLGQGGGLTMRWESDVNPEIFVLSANVWRGHLLPEQKREAIVAFIKADPKGTAIGSWSCS